MKSAAAMITLLSLVVGCGGPAANVPKHRKFDVGSYGKHDDSNAGGLYSGNTGLFEDAIATRIGDIVIIKIAENDSASHQANATLNKNDDTAYGMPGSFGLLESLQKKFPNVDPKTLFETTVSQQFTGSGSIARQGTVTATLPVRVAQVMPNGDLYVEGEKLVTVGDEEHKIYMSGIVRRVDIDEDGSVLSSQISDAQVEYTGKGDIQDTQRRGWLSRIISRIWPF